MLEGKVDEPVARHAGGLPVPSASPAVALQPRLALATPVWFFVRPQLLSRAVPLPVGRDISRVSR
jgi:hypothetical protein